MFLVKGSLQEKSVRRLAPAKSARLSEPVHHEVLTDFSSCDLPLIACSEDPMPLDSRAYLQTLTYMFWYLVASPCTGYKSHLCSIRNRCDSVLSSSYVPAYSMDVLYIPCSCHDLQSVSRCATVIAKYSKYSTVQ